MAKSKRRTAFEESDYFDQMLDSAEKAQAEQEAREQGRTGKGRPGNAGEIGKDKRGVNKVTYALPVTRQQLVRQMAEAEDVSQTDIVEAAIVAFYNAWRTGQVDLEPLKQPTKSLRFLWVLEIEDDFFCPKT